MTSWDVTFDLVVVGTCGGLVCDEHSRVLREDASVIEGLYAAGNCTASVTAKVYPGAGASIAASYVFAFIAAHHACDKPLPTKEVTHGRSIPA